MVVTTVIFFVVGTSMQANRLRSAAVEHAIEMEPSMKGPTDGGVHPQPTQPWYQQDQKGQTVGGDAEQVGQPKNGDHDSFMDKFIDKGITAFWATVQAIIIGITMARARRRKKQVVNA